MVASNLTSILCLFDGCKILAFCSLLLFGKRSKINLLVLGGLEQYCRSREADVAR